MRNQKRMITGIDETGDFDPNSKQFNFFVAVHIDQNGNKLDIKRSQFNLWESSIPDKFKIKGEIKGQNIPDEYLDAFYNDVLDSGPKVMYSVIRITPSENSPEILEKHKKAEIASMERLIEEVTKANHKSWIEGYTRILPLPRRGCFSFPRRSFHSRSFWLIMKSWHSHLNIKIA
ncbi:MAG: hypothetical protein ACKOXB_00930 [Flavobacteriales bacterium]